MEGTIIHVAVDHLPGDRAPKPLWLWFGHPDAATVELTLLWRTYLRRFDIEHTFRFFKQTLGFTRARPRTPEQADRWAWLILVAYNQLSAGPRTHRGSTCRGRKPYPRTNSPRAGSVGAFAASDAQPGSQPARRKPHTPDPAAPKAVPRPQRHATPSARKHAKPTNLVAAGRSKQVKTQAVPRTRKGT